MRWLSKFDGPTAMANLPHATVMMGVPTYYTRLLKEPALDKAACSTMRLFISGSAPLLSDTFEEFEQRTGHAILERYGMTETGMNTSNPLKGERRAGTVGFPLPGISLRITADGEELATGEVGDLEVKGAGLFRPGPDGPNPQKHPAAIRKLAAQQNGGSCWYGENPLRCAGLA